MARRDLTGCRVLVTGASSGIGREIVRELAKYPVRFVLVARREDKLREIAAELRNLDRDAEVVAGDVTDPAVRHAAVQAAQTAFGGLDLLINNAGVGAIGTFLQADEHRLRRVMEVNFFAAVELIRAALPLLKQGHSPLIVNVSSILGRRGIPLYTEYCASKFALAGFSESLRAELTAEGIDLLVVSPGTTDTEFFDHLVERKGAVPWSENKGAPVAKVARAVVRAIRAGRHEIIPSFRGRMLLWLNRLCPCLVDWLMGRYGRSAQGRDDVEK